MKYNFAKLLQSGGLVRKYQTAAGGGISYNFDSFLNNLPTNQFQRGSTASSILWTPNWGGMEGKYANVAALEGSDLYRAFTKYILDHAKDDPRVMEYLKLLEATTTEEGKHDSILFNGENLAEGWDRKYKDLRNDGKYGYYHLGPEGEKLEPEPEPEPKLEPEPEILPIVTPEPETPKTTPEDITPETTQLISPKREFTPWTDWMALAPLLGNDLTSAERQAALQKLRKFALKQGPFLLHKITNNYLLRLGMQQNASELRDLAATRSNSSDMNLNLDNMRKYDTQAAGIENLADQLGADKFAKESKAAEAVTNTNKETEATIGNYNNAQNVNAWNNILDANMRRDLKRTQAINSFIGNMYVSHGEWLKDLRINDAAYLRGLNQYNATLDQLKAYEDYMKTTLDPYSSKAYTDFTTAAKNYSGDEILFDDESDYSNPEKLKELWAGDSNFVKTYKEQYLKELQEALKNYYKKMLLIGNNLSAANLLIPSRISNLGIYWKPNTTPTYSPLYIHKSGGKVGARFIDYLNHIEKELQELKKLQHKRDELSTKVLSSDLDRLSRESLALLRQVFK